jgi:excisionase family DNA binding protein
MPNTIASNTTTHKNTFTHVDRDIIHGQTAPDPILTKQEACQYLRVKERKFDYLRAAGKIRCMKFGASVRVHLSELKRYEHSTLE